MLFNLYTHRHFVFANALIEMRHRYAGTAMGVLWHVVHPLGLLLLFSFVFSELLPARLPSGGSMALFLITGLLPWLAFVDCTTRCTTALADNAHYIRKLALPEVLYVARTAVGSALLMLITIALALAAALVEGAPFGPSLLTVPLAALLLTVFGLGLGLLLAPLHVFLKDTAQALTIVMQFWMWLSPVILVDEAMPPGLRAAQSANPIAWYLQGIRDPLLRGEPAPWSVWAGMAIVSIGMVWLGALALRRFRSDVRDVI